jgi:hypothetical protein
MNAYRWGLVIVAVCLVATAVTVVHRHSQFHREVKDAVDAFADFDSRLQVGMDYHDYTDGVGTLSAALDRLGRAIGSHRSPAQTDLEAAFSEYSFALDVRRAYMVSDEGYNHIPASTAEGQRLVHEYHVRTTFLRDFKELGTNNPASGSLYVYLPEALSAIWEHAHSRVAETKKGI